MLDFDGIKVLSFDCYGTLIDWESGILSVLRPLLSPRGIDLTDTSLLQLYGRFEREAQAHSPFVNYRSVLQGVAARLADHLAIELDPEEVHALEDSMRDWQPFPDTIPALKNLEDQIQTRHYFQCGCRPVSILRSPTKGALRLGHNIGSATILQTLGTQFPLRA